MSPARTRRSQHENVPEVDLLSLAFNLPTRRDVRRYCQKQKSRPITVVFEAYDENRDESSGEEAGDEGSDDESDGDGSVEPFSSDYSDTGGDESEDHEYDAEADCENEEDSCSSSDYGAQDSNRPLKLQKSISESSSRRQETRVRTSMVKKRTYPKPKKNSKKKPSANRSFKHRLFKRIKKKASSQRPSSASSGDNSAHPEPSFTPVSAQPSATPTLYCPSHPLITNPLYQFGPVPLPTNPACFYYEPQAACSHGPSFALGPSSAPNFSQLPSLSQYHSPLERIGDLGSSNRPMKQSMHPPCKPIAEGARTLQLEIDHITLALMKRPGDNDLTDKLKSLRDRLNSTLNMAMGQHVMYKPSQEAPNPLEPRNRGITTAHGIGSQRSVSLERPLHHVCFGCGSVRSSRYHQKHPLTHGQNIRNYCEDCRELMHQAGVVGDRHSCFGCGRVRSKRFHRRHPALSGSPLLPNYCAPCTQDMRDSEETVEESVLSSNFEPEKQSNDAHDIADGSDVMRAKLDDDESVRNSRKVVSPVTQRLPRQKISDGSDTSRRAKGGESSSCSPLASKHSRITQEPKCQQGHGQKSSRRRKKRSTSRQFDSSAKMLNQPPTKSMKRYRAPYAEDATSDIQCNKMFYKDQDEIIGNVELQNSRRSSKPPGHSRTTSESKERSTFPDNFSSSTSSPNRPESLKSDCTGSSGSIKSVRFNPAVKVRRFCAQAASNVSSDSDTEDGFIKPDDNSEPTRVGIYGESPVRSSNGWHQKAHNNVAQHQNDEIQQGYPHGGGNIGSLPPYNGVRSYQPTEPVGVPISQRGVFSGMGDLGADSWKRKATGDYPPRPHWNSTVKETKHQQGPMQDDTEELNSRCGNTSPHDSTRPVSPFFRGTPNWAGLSSTPSLPQSQSQIPRSQPFTSHSPLPKHYGSDQGSNMGSFISGESRSNNHGFGNLFSSGDPLENNPYYTPPPRRNYSFYTPQFYPDEGEKQGHEDEEEEEEEIIPEPIIEEAGSEVGSPASSPVLLLGTIPLASLNINEH